MVGGMYIPRTNTKKINRVNKKTASPKTGLDRTRITHQRWKIDLWWSDENRQVDAYVRYGKSTFYGRLFVLE